MGEDRFEVMIRLGAMAMALLTVAAIVFVGNAADNFVRISGTKLLGATDRRS